MLLTIIALVLVIITSASVLFALLTGRLRGPIGNTGLIGETGRPGRDAPGAI